MSLEGLTQGLLVSIRNIAPARMFGYWHSASQLAPGLFVTCIEDRLVACFELLWKLAVWPVKDTNGKGILMSVTTTV